jgi:hypothetical protein
LGPGPALALNAGYRWRFLYLGAAYQHVFLGGATYAMDVETQQTLAASSDYGGIDLVAITNPDALIAAFFRVGAGYRVIRWSQLGAPTDMQSSNVDLTLLGIGVQLNINGWLRIIPQASFELGPLNVYTSLGVTTYFDCATLTR